MRWRASAITDAWDRLDRASSTMVGLSGRLTGPGEAAMLEARWPSSGCRPRQRVASVDGPSRSARPTSVRPRASHASLAEQFVEGVEAYERLVAAAAGYVAEDGHPLADPSTGLLQPDRRHRPAARLAEGLSELKRPPATSI